MTSNITPARFSSHLFLLRRIEGAAFAVAAITLFTYLSGDWWFFAAVLLLPDLAMIGYLKGARAGAIAYNAFHTYLAPVIVGLAGAALDHTFLVAVSTIWVAHIGIDRTLGYGLKYSTGFNDTHLSHANSTRES